MKNIAVIPARSGSKGLKDKNIKLLNDKPLLAYSIEAAVKSEEFDCIHVSTDSIMYAEIAKRYGASVDFMRIDELATDEATSVDVLKFVIREYQKRGRKFDSIATLQPTSPLRTEKHIKEAYDLFRKKDADSVVSVCKADHIPLSNILPPSGSLYNFIDAKNIRRRQETPQYYRINGALYIQKVQILENNKGLYGPNSYAYMMDKSVSIDIDDEYDFKLAGFLMLNA